MEFVIIIFRFLIAFTLAFLYGIQRQRANKPIGFGTFIFVTSGACALTIAALELSPDGNIIPIIGAIVTGIGFLGAGALIRNSDRVFGFTAAASIWLFAIFGVLVGAGQYLIGLTIYASIWFVVMYDKFLEESGLGSYRRKITIDCKQIMEKKDLIEVLVKHCKHFHLLTITLNKREKVFSYIYQIEGPINRIEYLIKELQSKPWCGYVKFE